VTIDGARGILFNVTGGPDMSLYEVNQAAAIIRETAHPDANMIFGAVIDESMGDELRITVIATGFERTLSRRQLVQQQYAHTATPATPPPARPQPQQAPVREERAKEPVQPKFTPNNLDIPAFLRRR
jgi:cell division protein FtsZ